MTDVAYDYRLDDDECDYELIDGKVSGKPRYEIIGGEKFIMSPAPSLTHITIMRRLIMIFGSYIDENGIQAEVFPDNTDVYFSTEDHYMPDLSVVCNPAIIANGKKVLGVPDLIVEVLSESTMKNDLGKKKEVYEKYGVREYWIVNPWLRQITVYHLIKGKFKLSGEYDISDDDSKNKINVSIFDGMIVDTRKVFKFVFNFESI